MSEGNLTKAALIEEVADVAGLTKKRAEVIVDTLFGSIAEALRQGEHSVRVNAGGRSESKTWPAGFEAGGPFFCPDAHPAMSPSGIVPRTPAQEVYRWLTDWP